MNSFRYLIFVFSIISSSMVAQQGINFNTGSIRIRIDPIRQYIDGEVEYEFTSNLKTDSVLVNARKLTINQLSINGKNAEYSYKDSLITIYKKIKAGKSYELSISYETAPQKAVYFVGWQDKRTENNQVWTQGQGKYSSHWVPSFDDMSEKVIFDLEIGFDKEYEVVANGTLLETQIQDSIKIWKYTMRKPMSSYLLAFAAGLYNKDTIFSKSEVPLVYYSYRNESDKIEPTYRFTSSIMDFLEEEIGIPYPWQNYKQVPARDFLYAGMENTGTTIFSDNYFIDSLAFEDKNYVEVNAHEMAHQWFGNLVTELSGKDHWLHEGFATYYSLLARKYIFGEEYFYWKLFESSEVLADEKGEALTDPGASSLTFYEKGAWALVMLRDQIGDVAFRNGIKNYLQTFAFRNAQISDFINVMQLETDYDLKEFEETWLRSADFPMESAREYLKKESESLKSWYDLRWELTTSSKENELIINRYWQQSESLLLKKQILSKFTRSLSEPFLKSIFESGDVELRKMLAVQLERIPIELRAEFESLLMDPSYITKEHALFKLWIYFPGERMTYLDKTRDIIGLPNYNVRILWLFLAILTQDFDTTDAQEQYRRELFGYTSPEYAFEIRQTAFTIITEVFELPEQNLRDLVNATVHHVWQFRSYARNLLAELLKDEKQKSRLSKITDKLDDREKRYLIKQLETK